MKIKNGLLLNPNFIKSIQKLFTIEMPAKQCLELSMVLDEVDPQIKILQRSKYIIIDKLAKKDADGKIITDDTGEAQFKDIETRQKCFGQVTEILNEDFEISLKKKVLIDEDDKRFTPQDLMILRELIEVKEVAI